MIAVVSPVRLAERLDQLLPQTQCTRCGYPGCRPYAEALATGETTANRCEPGGTALMQTLAALTRAAGLAGAADLTLAHPEPVAHVAVIRLDDCIGCARCLPACPVDAIVGARRLGHVVLTADCTGCDLCLPACPVDCIDLIPPPATWQPPSASDNRRRHQQHQARLAARRRMAAPSAATDATALATVPPADMPPADVLPPDVLPVENPPTATASSLDAAQMTVDATPPATDRASRRASLIAAAQAAAAARRSQR